MSSINLSSAKVKKYCHKIYLFTINSIFGKTQIQIEWKIPELETTNKYIYII